MLKSFAKFVYILIFSIDFLIKKLFKRSYLNFLYEYIRQNSYSKFNILNKDVKFFTPNYYTSLRVNTFYSKEPETLKWIDNFNEDKNIIFWDIGANIGLYSIYAALKFPKLKVIAFEPSLNNLPVLSRNIYINKLLDRISISQFPLSNEENKFLTFRENDFIEGGGLNAFGVKFDYENKSFEGKNNYKIFGSSINNILDNNILEIPDYIKIDVDGIEHMILEGGNKYLSNKKIKQIIVELNESFKEQLDRCDKILKNNNFRFVKKDSADFDNKELYPTTFNYIYKKY
tara:strand:+ start:241 stop:1101 length:861 start_codon:yes stop_codon:yes gene_type:complete